MSLPAARLLDRELITVIERLAAEFPETPIGTITRAVRSAAPPARYYDVRPADGGGCWGGHGPRVLDADELARRLTCVPAVEPRRRARPLPVGRHAWPLVLRRRRISAGPRADGRRSNDFSCAVATDPWSGRRPS